MARDASVRQGEAVRLATAAFEDNGAVRLFLNSFHSGLDARPLDLAVASAAGLKKVEEAIAIVSAAQQNLERRPHTHLGTGDRPLGADCRLSPPKMAAAL